MKVFKKSEKCILCSIIILFLFWSNTVYAQGTENIQTYCSDEQIWMYLNEARHTTATAQIGNVAVAEVEVKSLTEVNGGYIHTIFLFDNSLSISEKNRDKMKNVVKELISRHEEKEVYTLATFDEQIHMLSAKSSNYTELLSLVDQIEFVNQNTYLKNVLFDTFASEEQDDKCYKRYIILSDGADDNEVGYTYDEIVALLKDKSYPVYAVGSKYASNIGALEEMFSISRAANTPYFLLDEIDDINIIVDTIRQDSPKAMACITIPEEVKDGSEKGIQLTVVSEGVEKRYTTKAIMPFGNIQMQQEQTEEVEESESEVIPEEVQEDKEDDEENNIIFVVIGIVLGVIVVAGIIYFILKQKKSKEKGLEVFNANNVPDMAEEEEEVTVLMQTIDDPDDCTVLLTQGKTIILTPEGIGGNSLKSRCDTQITVGRKSGCDICIVDDKAVSGIHCIIFCDYDGDLSIRDNNSSNGTYLNEQRIMGERKLESGDVLEIGKTRYSVQIIEE